MQSSTIKFWLSSGIILFYLLAPKLTTAQQVVPEDNTLNSIVERNSNEFQITGGTTRGINLFHGFKEFSIPEGGIANFISNPAIQNIISRVTGGSRSDIYGTIKVTGGDANLFLLNPNGIIFGPNASLDIRGSFIASTASSLKFADGTEFRTDGTQTTPLLTMSVPIGLQFGANPKPIQNQSTFEDAGLKVPSEKTLALVGGDVVLDGGILTAPGGRIELGSVAGNNLVSLKQIDQSWVLGYEGIQNFQDISLSNAAFVDTESDKGGDIQIQGKNVTLTGGSQVISATKKNQAGNVKVSASEQLALVGSPTDRFVTALFNLVRNRAQGGGGSLQIETKQLIVQGAQISVSTDGGQGVDLNVNASESVELAGVPGKNTGVFAQVTRNATGNGGNLTINTKRLTVRDGAQASTTTSGARNAGNLTLNASESVLLKGATSNGASSSGLYAQVQSPTLTGTPAATGNAGDLTITTKKLEIIEGAQISAATLSAGNGGNLTINASDIFLNGSTAQAKPTPEDQKRSGIFVAAFKNNLNDPRVLGNVGNLNITTEQLTVENGARISANNFGSNQGGSATLNVGKLVIQKGGEVTAQSLAQGPGGTLNVNASESVKVTGTGTIASTPVPSKLSAEATSSGKAGDVNITTPRLDVGEGGEVSVSGKDSGQAGNLTITANNIRLNQGNLTATTNAGEGANITLQNVDQLLMENNSKISAEAFENAKGGNISIDAANGFVVGVPDQNNDIVANAIRGNGGDIRITTSGIYGFTVGTSTENTNDINASSQFGLPGTVTINRAEVDPTQSLVELPANAVDPSRQIASGCGANNVAGINQFTITGRGGLPPSPDQPLSSDVLWSDTRIPKITAQGGGKAKSQTVTTAPSSNSRAVVINPATGWVFNGKGEVTLISSVSTGNSNPSLQNSASCAAR
ncbi:S-layer family protein [Scytonema tolypothrichoides VB-61278]|nr:S-layer family protein [Scytonema tolypothrichoides VB-61278]